jgi:RNA polymerase-binding transcription factor DksA
MSNKVVRYSDAELAEFKTLIEGKLVKAKAQLDSLQEQILEIAENTGDEHGGDWMDDSSTNNDMEMLNNMAIRQRRFIQDLENALIRIRNKVYGVCSVTGELIDKKRLLAVPTTTKSLQAKTQAPVSRRPVVDDEDEDEKQERKKAAKPKEKKVISRIIKKSSSAQKPPKPILDDDEDEEGYDIDELDIDDMDDNMLDIDDMEEDIADESSNDDMDEDEEDRD